MGQASTIGLDIAKWVFQAHGADAAGRVVFRTRLVRAKGACRKVFPRTIRKEIALCGTCFGPTFDGILAIWKPNP